MMSNTTELLVSWAERGFKQSQTPGRRSTTDHWAERLTMKEERCKRGSDVSPMWDERGGMSESVWKSTCARNRSSGEHGAYCKQVKSTCAARRDSLIWKAIVVGYGQNVCWMYVGSRDRRVHRWSRERETIKLINKWTAHNYSKLPLCWIRFTTNGCDILRGFQLCATFKGRECVLSEWSVSLLSVHCLVMRDRVWWAKKKKRWQKEKSLFLTLFKDQS